MIIKKTFVTTSSFLITALMLSQIYSFKKNIDLSRTINYSAFTNFSQNIKNVSAIGKEGEKVTTTDLELTNDVIKVIDNEISKKISKTRSSIHHVKPSVKKIEIAVAAVEPKIDMKQGLQAADLSLYEINNSEFINLYALSNEGITFKKFESTNLAYSYEKSIKDESVKEVVKDEVVNDEVVNDEVVNDEVSLAQSSTSTDSSKLEKEETPDSTKEIKEDEEMVMFDYSDKSQPVSVAKTIDQKLYERPLSKTVQMAINREIGNKPIKKLVAMNTQNISKQNITKIDNQEIDLNSDENVTYDYSQPKNKIAQISDKEALAEINEFTTPTKTTESQFIITAKEINLSTQKKHQLTAFEFVPDYDRAERSDDQGSGQIAFGYSLSGEMNTQTGVVQAQGMISTRVELNLEGKATLDIPLINEAGMEAFLQKKGLSIEGNLLLLAIDPSIIDTEIDSKFAERFFFDKNFKSMPSATGASLVMYAGVKTGNIMIRYLLNNKEIAQKIVYVGDGEMYFEDAEFAGSNRETFTFTTRNLLGQKRKELIIDGEDISYFNTNIKAKKKALNAYDIKIPNLTSGMRKYLEFKNLKDNIFVGTSNAREIEIPSNDFIAKVLEMNQISSLKDRCVVQLNLSKDLREIKANGKNRSGEMFVETSFLDSDGNFSKDNSEKADKIFVTGDLEGQFNIKLDYTDGTTEFLKTFCSEGTYLVEQL